MDYFIWYLSDWKFNSITFIIMMKKFIYIVVLITVLFGCDNATNVGIKIFYEHPETKIWAHKVGDPNDAQVKKDLFGGVELDVVYSAYQNTIFKGYYEFDTIMNVTIGDWLSSLDIVDNSHYWFDIKNLTVDNADDIAIILCELGDKYNIRNKIIIESPNYLGLKIIKKYNIAVLLWLDPLDGWTQNDTILWKNVVVSKVKDLQPTALSSNAKFYSLILDVFPDMDIYLWNTPIIDYEQNLKFTKELYEMDGIKVILVDYDEPII